SKLCLCVDSLFATPIVAARSRWTIRRGFTLSRRRRVLFFKAHACAVRACTSTRWPPHTIHGCSPLHSRFAHVSAILQSVDKVVPPEIFHINGPALSRFLGMLLKYHTIFFIDHEHWLAEHRPLGCF